MPVKFEGLDPKTQQRIYALLKQQDRGPDGQALGAGEATQTVAGSHLLKCGKGHKAMALVWSDGRVEIACPVCGQYELSREPATPGAQPPSARSDAAAALEDTQPLLGRYLRQR